MVHGMLSYAQKLEFVKHARGWGFWKSGGMHTVGLPSPIPDDRQGQAFPLEPLCSKTMWREQNGRDACSCTATLPTAQPQNSHNYVRQLPLSERNGRLSVANPRMRGHGGLPHQFRSFSANVPLLEAACQASVLRSPTTTSNLRDRIG